ncbi:MAG: hypothetical protein RBS81_10215 [Tenuifilaceae bacterium]|jgi:DNA-binding NarL/FixJ family response regulator|nr:hypothetical protein [Tenuifilaceae bacterium]
MRILFYDVNRDTRYKIIEVLANVGIDWFMCVGSSEELFSLIDDTEPEILIISAMPYSMLNLDLIAKVTAIYYPHLNVIALSNVVDPIELRELIEAGVLGFISISMMETQLNQAIQHVIERRFFFGCLDCCLQ